MVIKAPVSVFAIILRSVQQLIIYVFEKMHDAALFVIPVHNGGFIRRIDRVVALVFLRLVRTRSQLSLQLRICIFQFLVVMQFHIENVLGFLNIVYARLPEKVQNVHVPDFYISQSMQLFRIPEYAHDSRAAFQLLPPHIRIGLFKFVLLKDHREHRRQYGCIRAVARLTGQDDRFRIIVHRIRVLIQQTVQKPCARGLRVARVGRRAHALPMPQPVPLIVFHNSRIQRRLSAPVFSQNPMRLFHSFVHFSLLNYRLLRVYSHTISRPIRKFLPVCLQHHRLFSFYQYLLEKTAVLL